MDLASPGDLQLAQRKLGQQERCRLKTVSVKWVPLGSTASMCTRHP